MSHITSVQFEINEFQNIMKTLESKISLIYETVKESITDMNSAKLGLTEASANKSNEEKEELNKFKDKQSESLLKDCDSMKESAKNLSKLIDECTYFMNIESKAREALEQNPEQVDEKFMKVFLKSIPDSYNDHPKCLEIEELIENSRNGVLPPGDDLVMDTPQNQVIKCPITSLPIKVPIKNTLCDHVYEKEAVLNYCKSRARKCPYAGCSKNLVLKK